SDNAADHWSSNPFHDVGAGAVAPENWREPGDDDASRHRLWSNALDRSMVNRIAQVGSISHSVALLPFGVSQIEVEEHDHAGLGIETGEGDNSNPNRNAQVVV